MNINQKSKIAGIIRESAKPLSQREIAERLSISPSGITNNLKSLCDEGFVIKHKPRPSTYSWAEKEYVETQKEPKTKKNTESVNKDEYEEEEKINLEELVLRALMSVDRKPMTKNQISSLIEEKHSYDNCLNRLEKKGYISKEKKRNGNNYLLIREPIRIVYKGADNNSIDHIETLKNYKEDLSSLYMQKSKIDFNLCRLKEVSGLDLTENDTIQKATFSKHVELKEKLANKITDDNRKEVFAWIVNIWGGVKGETSIFITAFEKASKEKEKILESFASLNKRVASWSKILSFLYPHDYFIYDARVAFTLDYLLGTTEFPVPDGFNRAVNNHVEGRQQPTLDEYKRYCSMIKDIHSKLWPNGENKDKPYLTEMLIFALLNDVGFRVSIPKDFKLVF